MSSYKIGLFNKNDPNYLYLLLFDFLPFFGLVRGPITDDSPSVMSVLDCLCFSAPSYSLRCGITLVIYYIVTYTENFTN